MSVDLYEDEAGGLYMHRRGDANALAHLERDMSRLIANFGDTFAGVNPDPWSLFEVLAAELDALGGAEPDVWTNQERIPIEEVTSYSALVATWSGGRVEVHERTLAGSLPPGTNARIMLHSHQGG